MRTCPGSLGVVYMYTHVCPECVHVPIVVPVWFKTGDDQVGC